jgi:hypothetical protein
MEQNNKGDFYPKHQINIDPNILLWQKVYSETKTVKVVKEVYYFSYKWLYNKI